MQVTFYSFNGENDEVNKSLTGSSQYTGYLKDSCDYISPELEFTLTDELLTKNYAFIPKFNAYYFVTSRTITNKSIVLGFDIDELMTFKNEIINSFALITRTASGNLYLPDNRIRQTSKQTYVAKKLGSGFTKSNNYIIQIAGSHAV